MYNSNKKSTLIEGRVSVEAVLQSKYRKILTIFYDSAKIERKKNQKRATPLKKILKQANSMCITTNAVDQEWFERNTIGKTHGGIAATVSERIYQDIHEIIISQNSVIFMLEGIEDPYNLGYTIRSLYAAGIDGLVIKKRNWNYSENIIIKSSAGTSELIPIALIEDIKTILNYFKSKNFTITCTSENIGQSIFKTNLKPPLFIVIGGEKRGINNVLLDKADLLLKIPYSSNYKGSLPLSSAAIIMGFEILRQKSINTDNK